MFGNHNPQIVYAATVFQQIGDQTYAIKAAVYDTHNKEYVDGSFILTSVDQLSSCAGLTLFDNTIKDARNSANQLRELANQILTFADAYERAGHGIKETPDE